jgi:phage gp36-like protein
MLKVLAGNITLFKLAANKGFSSDENNPDWIFKKNYDHAIRFLEMVAKGEIRSAESLPETAISVVTKDKIFTDDLLSKY